MIKSTSLQNKSFRYETLFTWLLFFVALVVLSLLRHGSFLIPILFCGFGLMQLKSFKTFKVSLISNAQNRIWYTCGTFAFLCLISTAWSVLPLQTFTSSLQFLGLLCFYLLLFSLVPQFQALKSDWWQKLIVVFIIAGVSIWFAEKNIFNIRQLLGMHNRVFKPNVELLSLLAIPLGFYIYQTYARIFAILFASFALYLCVVSDIRASFYGLILGALSIPFWRYRAKLASLIAILGLIVYATMLPIAAYLFNYEPYTQFFVEHHGMSFLHRIIIWKFAAEKALEKIYLGWGAMTSKNFPEVSRIIPYEGSSSWPTLPSHPHNIFMQVWLELGGMGIGILLTFFALCIIGIRNIQSNMKRTAMGMLLSAVMPMLSLSHSLWHTWWISWIVFTGFLCLLLPEKK